ncbi:MAG: LPS-assembly protein LptD [Desulfatiglans sp.]|nr:LPS-assembly protein LptD [Desulfatiglans sp.]
MALASDGILLKTGEDTLTGESGTFNYLDKTGVINDASLFIEEFNFYFSGDRIEKFGDDSYLIKDFKLTTCDGDKPDWSITGSEINLTVEGYGRLRNAAFRVKDIPVAYVPYLLFPAKTKRASGILLPQAGYSSRNGLEFEAPIFWAISDSADMTFYERYMTERGLMQGLELRYVTGPDSKGSFNFDILSDRIDEKDMNDPDQLELSPYQRTNKGRYWFRGRVDQELPVGISARLDADVVSDQDYLREFKSDLTGFNTRPDYEAEFSRPLEEMTSPFRTSRLRLERDGENHSLQAASSFYQRPEGFINDTTPEPLAGLYYNLLPQFIHDLPFALSFQTDYDYIWRDFGVKGHSLSISPNVIYPVWAGKYMRFDTAAGYTRDMHRFDNGSVSSTDNLSRDMYYGSATLSTLLERVFDVDSDSIKRIKHKIVPGLTYEYRSHRDEESFSPWFESMDADGSANRVYLSIDNFLDAKNVDEKGNITYSQLATFSIIQGYDIDESRRDLNLGEKEKPFEPLRAELRIMPDSMISMNTETEWDHYRDDFTYADIAIKLDIERANRLKDIYRLDYVYSDTGNKGLGYYVSINLAKGFSVGSNLRRDIKENYNVEQSYWLDYSSKCWGIRLGMQRHDEESRVMLGFRLFGFND